MWVRALCAIALLCASPADAQQEARPSTLDLASRYATGDAAGAVDALVRLARKGDAEHVFRELEQVVVRVTGRGHSSFEGTALAQPIEVATALKAIVPPAAMLYVESARQLLATERLDEGVEYLLTARAIVDWPPWRQVEPLLPRDLQVRPSDRFRRDVYLAIAWTLQQHVQIEALLPHLSLAREAWPGDAELRLASGSLEELLSKPAILNQRIPPIDRLRVMSWRRTAIQFHLEKAESFHREAVARDPKMAEAYMRLGRVQMQLRKLSDARRALEAARDLGPVSDVGYLTALFLARMAEEEGRGADAFTQYVDMVKRWPGCQSAHMGLSRGFEARGERQLALGALQPLWQPRGKRTCATDPWWLYELGQAWRLPALVNALRAEVGS